MVSPTARYKTAPLVAALLACCRSSSGVTEQTLIDTTGASFTELCDSAQCTVTSTTPAPPACNSWTIVNTSRIAVVCGSPGAAIDPNCRPLTCSADYECPSRTGWALACQAGICQNVQRPLVLEDVLALCVAPNSRTTACDAQPPYADIVVKSAYETALAACSGECAVPPTCQQP